MLVTDVVNRGVTDHDSFVSGVEQGHAHESLRTRCRNDRQVVDV